MLDRGRSFAVSRFGEQLLFGCGCEWGRYPNRKFGQSELAIGATDGVAVTVAIRCSSTENSGVLQFEERPGVPQPVHHVE